MLQERGEEQLTDLGSLGQSSFREGWVQRPITHYHFWESGGVMFAVEINEDFSSSAEPELAAQASRPDDELTAVMEELALWRKAAASAFWQFENSLPT